MSQRVMACATLRSVLTAHDISHTSLHGAAAVICAVTGLVIDTHVMSCHCQLCINKKATMDEDAFEEWIEGHEEECQRNYDGPSGGMEVEAAKVLCSRSQDHGLRYTTMIGDGDSKTHNCMLKLKPYGDTVVTKAECVNHVAKRLGTGLRNLISEERKRGVILGGRGLGTLTQEKIGRLQVYYTRAIRGNTSVAAMKDSIWATFHHSSSTDESPKHGKCPGVLRVGAFTSGHLHAIKFLRRTKADSPRSSTRQ